MSWGGSWRYCPCSLCEQQRERAAEFKARAGAALTFAVVLFCVVAAVYVGNGLLS